MFSLRRPDGWNDAIRHESHVFIRCIIGSTLVISSGRRMVARCSETMLKRTLAEAKAKADAADAQWKKARLDWDARRVSDGVVRKAAARADSARVALKEAMVAADTADGSVVAKAEAEHAKAAERPVPDVLVEDEASDKSQPLDTQKPLDTQEVSAGQQVAFAPATFSSAASGALSAPVSRRWRSLAPAASGGGQQGNGNSLTAAASCAPSAAASGAPSDVAATLGALMRDYGDGDDREDLSDFWQLAD